SREFSEPFADNTYADILPPSTMRMLLAFVASNNLKIRHVDITAAFLHADLDYPIYIEQPHGREEPGNLVCKLRKAIHGLKTARRRWQEKLRGIAWAQAHAKLQPIDTLSQPGILSQAKETLTEKMKIIDEENSHIRTIQTTAGQSRDFFSLHLQLIDCWTLDVWNVYNAPSGSQDVGQGLWTILQSSPPSRILVMGDFNCRHASWDLLVDRRPILGEDLEEWTQKHGLQLLNWGTPTHSRGGVLDLAWSNVPRMETNTAPHLHTTSDHDTLLMYLTRYETRENLFQRKLKYDECDTKLLLQLLGQTSDTTSPDSQENARSLVGDSSTVVYAATLELKTRSIGTPRWTEECRIAAKTYKMARRTGTEFEEQKALRKTVRIAKTALWRSKADNAKDQKFVYKIVKWHKAAPSYSSPPLRGPNGEAYNENDKAVLLKSTLLDRRLDAEDFPPDVPTAPKRIVDCPNTTDYEIFKAVCVAKSSLPGGDKVPAKILRACWPVIKDRVCSLFRQCVQIGIHPK
ncbi:hypothetical protein EPUL_005004, partial [Erysiphe pulchra]